MAAKAFLKPELIEHVARRFRTLGDPTRLTILQALLAGPATVTEVIRATGRGQANVSKHLSVLADADILSRTRDGTRIIYEVIDPLVFKLCDIVCGSVRKQMAQRLKEHQKLLLGKR
ncbi:MAG: winged helix-turn-helix transcriptional regulator [Phycisphaerae bacterium]|nr:winged helix-turn-helix transcriptional regulator [Phycisphaerae bacterium]